MKSETLCILVVRKRPHRSGVALPRTKSEAETGLQVHWALASVGNHLHLDHIEVSEVKPTSMQSYQLIGDTKS